MTTASGAPATVPVAAARNTAPTHDDFAALEGHTFTTEVEPDCIAHLTLVRCSPAVRQVGWVSYTLTFEGASDQPLAQGTFVLSAEGLAPTAVFLVPIGPASAGTEAVGPDRLRYEAVFNQEEDRP